MVKRCFNIAGPCIEGQHYMLDPLRGIESDLMSLIDGNAYFVIHAARQTGKTTLLHRLIKKINAAGRYYALYCSLEAAAVFTDPKDGIPEIVKTIKACITKFGLPEGFAKDADYSHISGVLQTSLITYCRTLDKPLVIFFDEADGLSENALISFLRQLRDGYINRGEIPFVHSIALAGMRNLRDYKARVRSNSETLGGISPFNIIRESFSLRCFTHTEVTELYAQHTSDTGQLFERKMIDYVFEQTQGQPWLVNAIAYECVEKILKKDYMRVVSQIHAEQAVQNIIRDRRTHIDSMMYKLKDMRVRNVLLPMLLGEDFGNRSSEDYLFTIDLGIIRETNDGRYEPANPIYADMIIRTLNWDMQEFIKRNCGEYVIPRYIKNGVFDMNFLIKDFQEFWRENSEIWKNCLEEDLYTYAEAAPHLILYAFLQRIINGGGYVIREKSAGKKCIDLYIKYKDQKFPIELKILQNERSRAKSYEQLLSYMDKLGTDTGWLVIFDKDTAKSWDEKIFLKEELIDNKKIITAGC